MLSKDALSDEISDSLLLMDSGMFLRMDGGWLDSLWTYSGILLFHLVVCEKNSEKLSIMKKNIYIYVYIYHLISTTADKVLNGRTRALIKSG